MIGLGNKWQNLKENLIWQSPWVQAPSLTECRTGARAHCTRHPINLVILVFTNKWMSVRLYLDKGRVSDIPESAETVISEIQWKHSKQYKQTNKQHIFRLTPALSRFTQLQLAAHRKNTSKEVLLGIKLFLNPQISRPARGPISFFLNHFMF